MRFGLAAFLLTLVSFACIGQAPTRKAPVPTTHYTDAKSGISLDYPAIWKRVKGPSDYCGSQLQSELDEQPSPRFAVQFTGKGNYYRKTTLESLAFSFWVLPHSSPKACRKLADAVDAADPQLTHRVIHGVTYNYNRIGECGLSHGVDARVYTTFRSGNCYAFEEDLFSTDGVVIDGTRELTKSEYSALQRHLDQIMQSVTFAGY